VDLLVDEVLQHRSVALAAPPDGIEEPGALRRVDGSSVYTVAGADLYTSQRILDAEQRLISVADLRDGTVLDRTVVDHALLEMAANGTALDMGQASLIRQMCTSGARLQLAIAPAGAGKTTAMRALTLAWTEDGGQVIGLAPSAAAAAVLGEQTGIRTDTLAKLTWSLDHGDLPDWATGGRTGGKEIPTHSAFISIMAVFMSVISPRSPRMRLLLGFKIDRPDSTRSCSPPPGSSSPSSTAEP
jgi:AAA domain